MWYRTALESMILTVLVNWQRICKHGDGSASSAARILESERMEEATHTGSQSTERIWLKLLGTPKASEQKTILIRWVWGATSLERCARCKYAKITPLGFQVYEEIEQNICCALRSFQTFGRLVAVESMVNQLKQGRNSRISRMLLIGMKTSDSWFCTSWMIEIPWSIPCGHHYL